MTSSTQHATLLAEYTLGLLNTSETAQAHALLGSDQNAVSVALAWEQSLLELTDLLAPVDPSPLLLQRIQSSLGHDTMPTPASLYRKPDNDSRPERANPASQTRADPTVPAAPVASAASVSSLRTEPSFKPEPVSQTSAPIETQANGSAPGMQVHAQPPASEPEQSVGTDALPPPIDARGTTHTRVKHGNIWLWRCATLVFALIALALALIPSEPIPPPINIVQVAPTQAAILQAPGQSSTPAWVVTVDPHNNILMSPKVRSDIPADASVQLWTHNKSLPVARSLGLIDPNQPVAIPASLMGSIGADQIFEMTLEPQGGSPTASPSGPILFIGRIVTFGAPAPKATEEIASRPQH
ncbi:anti-sigma factor [Alcaligenaceae bacterium]|nr:anti-sigma factor [Alcaligenaceae bacterium]